MLKELQISGFKSFAKTATLEFRTSISAIVGPNGSGKSNVAEALRFVLGEQSIKSMRGKKGEDLIFNGSGGSARANRASVKVIFDNSHKIFDVDYEEVVIERVVHRDGTNEYLINGSQVRLRDIIELLSKANIGSTGHHIISQGEADRILSVGSKERKSIIEDALGLKIYQYKKEESQRKLYKTEENIKQVESLRREIAPHLKFLSKQVEKLEKLGAMKTELAALYLQYFKRENAYLKFGKARNEQEMSAPRAEIDALRQKLEVAKETLEKGESGSRMEELARSESVLEERRRVVAEISKNLGRIEGEISSVEKNLKRQKEFLEKERAVSVSLSEVNRLSDEIEEVSSASNSASDISTLKKIIDDIKTAVFNFVRRASGANIEENELIISSQKELAVLAEQKKELEKEFEVKRAAEREASDAYAQKRQKIEQEKDSYKEAEKEVYKIMARQNELQGILNAASIIEQKLEIEALEYERELSEALVIAGPQAIRFDDVVLKSEDGQEISEEEAALEERKKQEERKKEIEKIKIRLEDQGLAGSDEIIKEYRETTERDEFLERELKDLELSADSLDNLIKELEQKLAIEFESGVFKINTEFKKFFGMMFGGGEAGIKLVRQVKKKRKDTDLSFEMEGEEADAESADEEEVEEGIDVTINLPHKKIKSLMMLSGGERALSSIALLFAISQVNPPPFVVLDETDAALDESNSRKYADMVRALSKHSQIILITHNRETMNSANVIYGVTMGSDGISKLLSVSFDEATNYAK